MSTSSLLFVLDSDVFITAKNSYYGFDICPGFWRSVREQHRQGLVCSISRVRSELLAGQKTDELYKWVEKLPKSFFRDVDGEAITSIYGEIMKWSQRQPRFIDAAVAKFATGADGWLVAFAKAEGAIVASNEQPAPESKSAVKIPDVCDAFDVEYRSLFRMLRDLKVRFS